VGTQGGQRGETLLLPDWTLGARRPSSLEQALSWSDSSPWAPSSSFTTSNVEARGRLGQAAVLPTLLGDEIWVGCAGCCCCCSCSCCSCCCCCSASRATVFGGLTASWLPAVAASATDGFCCRNCERSSSTARLLAVSSDSNSAARQSPLSRASSRRRSALPSSRRASFKASCA